LNDGWGWVMADIFYLYYYDLINEHKTKLFMDCCTNVIRQHKPKTLYFLFSSQGGSVDAGIVLYNFIRSLPTEIVMHNIGNIMSIANIVFLAGDIRYAAQDSSFLLHGIKWTFSQGAQLTYNQLGETISSFRNEENKMIKIFTERTLLTEEEVRNLFDQGDSKNPSYALSKKIINEVRDIKIPENEQLLSMNFA
jgi:ATP-dependent Clp protease protease subunit